MSTPSNPNPTSPSSHSASPTGSQNRDLREPLQRLRTAIDNIGNTPVVGPQIVHDYIERILRFFEVTHSREITMLAAPFPQTPPRRVGRTELDSSDPLSTSRPSPEDRPHAIPPIQSLVLSERQLLSRNSRINNGNRGTMEAIYVYPNPGTILEYPETSSTGAIAHKIRMPDDKSWEAPIYSTAYAHGRPESRFSNVPSKFQKVFPLTRSSDGEMVDCQVAHTTCQGIKVCSFYDEEKALIPHVSASRESLRERLDNDRSLRYFPTDTTWDLQALLLQRTLAYYDALRVQGCLAPKHEETLRTGHEAQEYQKLQKTLEKARRGHDPKETCEGRLIWERWGSDRPVIRCEHYHPKRSRDHFVDASLSSGKYDLEYLEALFSNDQEATERIEFDLEVFHNTGPTSSCSFTAESSSPRVHCPFPHRDTNGNLVRAELKRLPCEVSFRCFQPLPEDRADCPWTLLVCRNAHTHPIPILSKTPRQYVSVILNLLRSLKDEMPDMTPRRLIRHPSAQALARALSPDTVDLPLLSDIHPSLANRDHLRTFIDKVKKELFPDGTGWKGLFRVKEDQDESSDPPYLRHIAEYPRTSDDDDDSADEAGDGSQDRQSDFMAVCMTKDASRRLLGARFLQSDIAFKRVEGVYELEIGGRLDAGASGLCYPFARIYLTSMTAKAHERAFRKIGEIVKEDTGQELRWRHLHANRADELTGICLFNVDQHRGQAKGLGLYLQSIAAAMPVRRDLHERHRTIQELGPYDHLRRVLHLCTNHLLRNIQGVGVSDEVKRLMRSLMTCSTQDDFSATTKEIRKKGGKAGNDWLNDKVTSKFAFAAMNVEQSFIPRSIWQLGDETTNLIESLHADTNHEGRRCSLLSGYFKGKRFDLLKEKTAKSSERYGVSPSHRLTTDPERILRGLKRKAHSQHTQLAIEDEKILKANKRLKTSSKAVERASLKLTVAAASSSNLNSASYQQAEAAHARAQERYEASVSNALNYQGTGSGRAKLDLPHSIAR